MRLPHILVLGGCAAALAACSSRTTDEALPTDTTAAIDTASRGATAAPAGAPAAAAITPQAFVDAASASDSFEILSGREALKRSADPAIKKFAQMTIDAHTKATAELKAAAARLSPKVEVLGALDATQRADMAKLKAATGPAFDTVYAGQQRAAHSAALALFNNYAANGGAAPLKDYAARAAQVISEHIPPAASLPQ